MVLFKNNLDLRSWGKIDKIAQSLVFQEDLVKTIMFFT